MKVSLSIVAMFISYGITAGVITASMLFIFGGSYWYLGFIGIGVIGFFIGLFVYILKKVIPEIANEQFNEMNVRCGMIALENSNGKPDRKRLYDLD